MKKVDKLEEIQSKIQGKINDKIVDYDGTRAEVMAKIQQDLNVFYKESIKVSFIMVDKTPALKIRD